MQPVARIFATADQARDAAQKLVDAGYKAGMIFVMAPPASKAAAADADGDDAPAATPVSAPSVEELVETVKPAGELGTPLALRLVRAMEQGKSVVVVGDLVGYLALAEQIMDECGAESGEALRMPKPNNPSPFSDFIGMPCLEDRLSFFSGDNPLKDSNWTLFPVELKDKLTFNVNLIDDPAPFSSKIGFKPLSAEKPWKTSFGFKLLSNQED